MPIAKEKSTALSTSRANPTKFVTDVLGVTPEQWQTGCLKLIAEPGAHVSVRSGHGVGKTSLAAWAILWHHACHFPAKTSCSAPTQHQLKDVLWSELSVWLNRLPDWLRSQYSFKSSDQDMRLYVTTHPDESFAVARTGRKENPEALQGFHSKNILFVLDEASGIADEVFSVAEGALSSEGARVLMTGNPTRLQGYFADSHHKQREWWKTMKVACQDSTLVHDSYIQRMKSKYGENSSIFRVRVLGEFPLSDDDVLMPLDLIEGAVGRDVQSVRDADEVWGLDVARFGNCRTALAKRRGNHLVEPVKSWSKRDLMEVAGLVRHEYELARIKPEVILVDAIGLGAGVVDRLKELGLPVRGINVGETPSGRDRFNRLRDELWVTVRRLHVDWRFPVVREQVVQV